MAYLEQKENLEGRKHLEELDIYKMLISKRILKKSDGWESVNWILQDQDRGQ
jgi:hypothetical protein